MRFEGNGAFFAQIVGKEGFFCGVKKTLISVKVHTIFELKKILGHREIDIAVPHGSNINGLLDNMVKKWGETLSSSLFDSEMGGLFSHIQIMVNGRSISFLNGMETVLEDHDDVLILPPAGGG